MQKLEYGVHSGQYSSSVHGLGRPLCGKKMAPLPRGGCSPAREISPKVGAFVQGTNCAAVWGHFVLSIHSLEGCVRCINPECSRLVLGFWFGEQMG